MRKYRAKQNYIAVCDLTRNIFQAAFNQATTLAPVTLEQITTVVTRARFSYRSEKTEEYNPAILEYYYWQESLKLASHLVYGNDY